jgi:hypothetical protein
MSILNVPGGLDHSKEQLQLVKYMNKKKEKGLLGGFAYHKRIMMTMQQVRPLILS